MLSWDSLRMYIVNEEEIVVDAHAAGAFDADDLCLADFLACQKRESRALKALNVLQNAENSVALDVHARNSVALHTDPESYVARALDAENFVTMQERTLGYSCQVPLANMPILGVHAAPPSLGKRSRPPKRTVLGRGRPKVCVATANLECNGQSLDVAMHDAHIGTKSSHARAHACGKGHKQVKKRGKVQKPTVKKFCRPDAYRPDDSRDEHAFVGEDDECEDELLEAEGPVLQGSDDEPDCSIDAYVPTWKSGDKMDVQPDDTFKVLPSFVDISGPNLGQIPREFTKIQLFLSMFPLELVDMIVSETNRYALEQQNRVLCKHGSTRRWNALDRHSFLRFLGVSLSMALQYMPDKNYYWKGETCGVMQCPNYAEKMGQTEYQHIKRFLHVRDNSQRPLVKGTREHKLWQVLPLEERLNATFQMHYNCRQNVTVDERIIPSKCKLNPCRVYNPKKAHKFGNQVRNLCDSETGYNYSFRVYDKLPCSELSYHVVSMLVNDLKQKGHHVFFDRWFTSAKLLIHLTNEGYGATGTYMTNRKNMPDFRMLHLERCERESFRFAYDTRKGLLACSWMDKKPIFFVSNVYGMREGEVQRQIGSSHKVSLACPEIAVQYNMCKAGCDVFDSMVLGSGYSLESTIHGWKWWHALFWEMLDSVLANAYII
ncbi:hypothetical protein L7F22_004614 [Adiantum nelumboides]|nr:hypothetical protein [Adiantum nelumboides]